MLDATAQQGAGLGKEIFEELLKRFDQVAAKLGDAAPHVWGWYVRQAYVEGIDSILLAAVFVILSLSALKIGYIGLARHQADEYADSPWVLMILGWVACAVLVIPAVCNLYIGVMMVCNPSFYALQSLLGRS